MTRQRTVELSEKRLGEHVTTVQRSLVLLARVPQASPEDAAVALDTRRRLRELLETLEAAQ